MKLGNKVIKIISVDSENFLVKLKFSDGAIYTTNLSGIFSPPKGIVKDILRGNLFDKCFLESGALAWPNGFELCPDWLRMVSENKLKVA